MNRTWIITAAGFVGLILVASYFAVSGKKDPPTALAEDAKSEVSSSMAGLENGEAVYDYWCAACHDPGPGHPGTQSLEVKYGGDLPAALEDRTDLDPQTTAYFVRNGYALMPPFRKTEISDGDLHDLAAYLAKEE